LLKNARGTVDVLVTQMDAALLPQYLALAQALREAGIRTEAVLEGGKLGKQFKYADRAGIRYALVLGEDELARGVVALKNLASGEQREVACLDLIRILQER
ncbi:MAG: His/Gly/Thr/Pro-type tRNA ligase C-terminal domain-containing protein, partial [Rhodanobacteraceae bacterium]